jgi:hypothetical protein
VQLPQEFQAHELLHSLALVPVSMNPHFSDWVEPSAHTPSSEHALQAFHWYSLLHTLELVPQFPHGLFSTAPDTHSPSPVQLLHAFHKQQDVHALDWLPPNPHALVSASPAEQDAPHLVLSHVEITADEELWVHESAASLHEEMKDAR